MVTPGSWFVRQSAANIIIWKIPWHHCNNAQGTRLRKTSYVLQSGNPDASASSSIMPGVYTAIYTALWAGPAKAHLAISMPVLWK